MDATKTPDLHDLYESAVQCPEADIVILDRMYRKRYGRLPGTLREDFCGTAALAAEFVRTRPGNRAVGIDLHPPTLEWGRKNRVEPLGEAASRVRLINDNVLSVKRPRVDLAVAFNFSYFVFRDRPTLRRYFATVRRALNPEGMFVLDIFGGWEAQALTTEKRRKRGFTYVWEQTAFDPITHETTFHIHFHLKDGRKISPAFTYHWRFWTIPEVREILIEAGFEETEVRWEGTDPKTGKGNGIFRLARRAETCPGWIAYIVAV